MNNIRKVIIQKGIGICIRCQQRNLSFSPGVPCTRELNVPYSLDLYVEVVYALLDGPTFQQVVECGWQSCTCDLLRPRHGSLPVCVLQL